MRPRLMIVGLTVGLLLGASPVPVGATTFDAHTVAISPEGSTVAAGQWGHNYSAFSRNATTSALTALGPLSPGVSSGATGCFCQGIAFGPDGQSVYSAINGRNSVIAATVTPTGTTDTHTYNNNNEGISGLVAPQSIVMSPDGNNVYVTVGYPGGGGIVVFSRAANGALTFVEKEPLPSGSSSGYGIRVSRDGKFASR